MNKRLAICITGASGSIYGYRFLEEASRIEGIETHLVISRAGAMVLNQELGINANQLQAMSDFSYDENNMLAPIASGSFGLDGVLVAPCSMKTLSAIAHGYDANLVSRTASVALKEKTKLILMPRETPLSSIQIRNMLIASKAGAMIMPPMHPFYFKSNDLNALIDITIGRVLSMFGIESSLNKEWSGVKSTYQKNTPG